MDFGGGVFLGFGEFRSVLQLVDEFKRHVGGFVSGDFVDLLFFHTPSLQSVFTVTNLGIVFKYFFDSFGDLFSSGFERDRGGSRKSLRLHVFIVFTLGSLAKISEAVELFKKDSQGLGNCGDGCVQDDDNRDTLLLRRLWNLRSVKIFGDMDLGSIIVLKVLERLLDEFGYKKDGDKIIVGKSLVMLSFRVDENEGLKLVNGDNEPFDVRVLGLTFKKRVYKIPVSSVFRIVKSNLIHKDMSSMVSETILEKNGKILLLVDVSSGIQSVLFPLVQTVYDFVNTNVLTVASPSVLFDRMEIFGFDSNKVQEEVDNRLVTIADAGNVDLIPLKVGFIGLKRVLDLMSSGFYREAVNLLDAISRFYKRNSRSGNEGDLILKFLIKLNRLYAGLLELSENFSGDIFNDLKDSLEVPSILSGVYNSYKSMFDTKINDVFVILHDEFERYKNIIRKLSDLEKRGERSQLMLFEYFLLDDTNVGRDIIHDALSYLLFTALSLVFDAVWRFRERNFSSVLIDLYSLTEKFTYVLLGLLFTDTDDSVIEEVRSSRSLKRDVDRLLNRVGEVLLQRTNLEPFVILALQTICLYKKVSDLRHLSFKSHGVVPNALDASNVSSVLDDAFLLLEMVAKLVDKLRRENNENVGVHDSVCFVFLTAPARKSSFYVPHQVRGVNKKRSDLSNSMFVLNTKTVLLEQENIWKELYKKLDEAEKKIFY